MTEYIKREDAINLLWFSADEPCSSVISDFEGLPSADVAEVRYGRWEMDGRNHCHCTNCNFGRHIGTQIGWNYCPNCGVCMDKEK